MVSRKLLAIIVTVVAVGRCHGQVGTAVSAENETLASFGERLQPTPASATIQEIHAELNRTTNRAQANETAQGRRPEGAKRSPTSEPLEGHSSDLLASVFGEPGELEISGIQLPAGAETGGDQRRFDDATLAMASTGQARGNRFLMPSESQFGANSRLMLKQQQLLAALDPLGSGDPYFMDSISPAAAAGVPAAGELAPSRRRGGSRQSHVGRPGPKTHQNQQRRASDVEEPEEDPEYRRETKFAEGDDIFRDDTEPAPRQRSASVRAPASRSATTDESPADDDDDDEEEADGTGSETTGTQVPAGEGKLAHSNRPTKSEGGRRQGSPGDGPRRPLKGIEDSAQAQDERLDASNLKASKRRPEVELVLRSYQSKAPAADSRQLVEKSGASDLQAAAGHHHGHHGHGGHHYYQYAGSPKKKAWKMGFKRGNHKHEISRHEKGYKNKFHSSFKWHAKEKCKKKKKCHSVGKMSWHYEHHDKKKKHHY